MDGHPENDPATWAIHELVVANRILANEGIIDDFGHVSIRHPARPARYFLSRSRSPQVVTRDDIMEFDLDNAVVGEADGRRPYKEAAIHGCVYAARPDVNSVVHHHAPPVLPFTVCPVPLRPVFHMGAVMGREAPVWDSQDEFGDTNMLVDDNARGASMARALGAARMVLLKRHGATVVGGTLHDAVFTSIHSTANARLLLDALPLGAVDYLTPGEIDAAAAMLRSPLPQARAWEFWRHRIGLAGL